MLIFMIPRRFKWIILVLLSICVIQLVLSLILAWTSESPLNGTDVITPNVSKKGSIKQKSTKKIDLSHLPFKASCAIRNNNAASAIERAKSIKCKEELVNVTCMIQRNQLYPQVLSTNCPHKGKLVILLTINRKINSL